MIYRIAARVVGFSLWAMSTAVAAEPEPRTSEPEQTAVVQASYEASRDGKWDAYAAVIDPRDLAEFKQQLRRILQSVPVNPAVPANGLLDLFDGGTDLKTVAAWQPPEFLARFMRGTSAKTPLWQGQAGMKFKIIGIVQENADQAHAVVRVEKTMQAMKISRNEVVSLHRVAAADWKVTLPDELRSLPQTLSAAMFLPQPTVQSETTIDKAEPE